MRLADAIVIWHDKAGGLKAPGYLFSRLYANRCWKLLFRFFRLIAFFFAVVHVVMLIVTSCCSPPRHAVPLLGHAELVSASHRDPCLTVLRGPSQAILRGQILN